MTTTMTTEVVETRTSQGEGPAAHIVHVPAGSPLNATAYVLKAMVEGIEIEALCGHTWIPARDPKPLPICEKCLASYQGHVDNNRDDRNELPDA